MDAFTVKGSLIALALFLGLNALMGGKRQAKIFLVVLALFALAGLLVYGRPGL